MSADDWVEDITGAESENDDDETETLFQSNFRQMVDEGTISELNPQTIEQQIDQIEDTDVLETAIEQDGRDECVTLYEDRIEAIESDDEPAEPSGDETSESVEMGDDGEPEEEAVSDAERSDGDDPETDADGEAGEDESDDLTETDVDAASDPSDEIEVEDAPDDPADAKSAEKSPEADAQATDGGSSSESETVDIDVSSIAPSAVTRDEAAQTDEARSLLVWGLEGTGKSHVAHSAPGPVAYLDTEGKATDIADKFDKQIFYWQPDDYQDATDALEEAFDLLAEYRDQGVLGTLVVDSITKMWDWAKQDYQELAFPSADDPSEVDFKSALQGEDDWTQIKRRHNQKFRDRILDSPYHVVFTARAKEDYNAVIEGAEGKPMTPDGEKDNQYEVQDVVRLRSASDGTTVGDLHKSGRTKYSFIGLEWPEWDSIYAAVNDLTEAEKADEAVDVSQWPYEVAEGQPVAPSGGSDDDE